MMTEAALSTRIFGDDKPSTGPLAGGDEEESKFAAKSKQNKGLIASVVAWYAASVVCTNTTKTLSVPWQWLTLAQLVIGSMSAYFGITVLQLSGKQSPQGYQLADLFPQSRQLWNATIVLAATFVGGFVTLNMALAEMHVSTVMTMRAAEPVATFLLGLYFLPQDRTPLAGLLALIVVVIGAGMASVAPTTTASQGKESTEPASGYLLVVLCNGFFACRTIFTKLLKAASPSLDNFTLFFQLCVVGTCLHLTLLCSMITMEHMAPLSSFQNGDASSLTASLLVAFQDDGSDGSPLRKVFVLFVNGISFYAYLQLSWVVMGQVGAVTHSVCNSLRRPVICAAGWILFGGATAEGVVGAFLATAGTLLYARAKLKAASVSTAMTMESNGQNPDRSKEQHV